MIGRLVRWLFGSSAAIGEWPPDTPPPPAPVAVVPRRVREGTPCLECGLRLDSECVACTHGWDAA